jgi:outer membrane protein
MKKLTLSVFLLVLGFNVSLSAQSFKVGFTDPEYLLVLLPEYKTAMQKLDTLYAADQGELRQKAVDFQALVQDYEAKSPLMSNQARQEKEEELGALQNELEQLQSTKSARLNRMEQELMQPLLSRISAAINKVSKARALDLVFSARAGNNMILLYAKEEEAWDISLDVLKELGVDTTAIQTGNGQ